MDVNRNTQIVINDDLLRKIVYCIEKAIGDDLQQYLRENHRETKAGWNDKFHQVRDCML